MPMWIILDILRGGAVLFFAVISARLAAAIVDASTKRGEDEPETGGWRWWLAWAVLLSIGAALVDLQFGGFYSYTDPAGGSWDFEGHGWPLVHQQAFFESWTLVRSTDVALYLLALAFNLFSLAILLAAAKFVVGRWLLGAAGARRNWRGTIVAAAGWLAALGGVLWIERWFAVPVEVPGTGILVYTPLVYLPWYSRAPVLFALVCALFIVGWWIALGTKAFFRLRDEGVL